MPSFDQALTLLGRQIGIDGLGFGETGLCRLESGDVLVDVGRNDSGTQLLFSALVGELPDTDREAVLLALLDMNSFLRGTGGATIGVPKGSGAVVLAQDVTAQAASPEGLLPALMGFVDAAERIGKVLQAEPAGPAPGPDSLTMMRV